MSVVVVYIGILRSVNAKIVQPQRV